VILKALSGELKWVQAAEICGLSCRQMLRKRRSFELHGINGLLDGRRGRPSGRKVALEEASRILELWVTEYSRFNVKHFHECLVSDHGIKRSYTLVKDLLQSAGYVKRGKGRGGHRKRRERRPVFGQMVHLDGSDHEWLALRPGERQVLLLVIDDATGWNLAGRLVDGESTKHCLGIMREVVERYGIPAQLYTDRGSVYWQTKKAGGLVDKEHPTHFGEVMEKLGVEMIAGYSPQARGRGERWNGTWQGRLVAELEHAGIFDLASANGYICDTFIPSMNERFTVDAAESGSAFVGVGIYDLDELFSIHHGERVVGNDNTVRAKGHVFQIEKSSYRAHFCKCTIDVFEHLDGSFRIEWKHRVIGRYDASGASLVDLGLSLSGPGKVVKKEQKKRRKCSSSASAPSPVVPRALGSVPTVALSSRERRNRKG
jgi:transposase InsO family protein